MHITVKTQVLKLGIQS